jgi:hypothetical protein
MKITTKQVPTIEPALNQAVDNFENEPIQTPQQYGVDTFESAPSHNSEFQDRPKPYSIAEMRQMITAAKAINKPPFSEANLNGLLAKNNQSYKEITADLKNWINNNLYLTARQKGEFQRMPESGVKQIQISADKATELGKRIQVEIRDDDKFNPLTANFEKTVHYEDTEIAENVKIKLNKLQIVPHQNFEQFNKQQDLNILPES